MLYEERVMIITLVIIDIMSDIAPLMALGEALLMMPYHCHAVIELLRH